MKKKIIEFAEAMLYASVCWLFLEKITNAWDNHRSDVINRKYNNARRCFTAGVWKNINDNSIYNFRGDRIGFVTYDWKEFKEGSEPR